MARAGILEPWPFLRQSLAMRPTPHAGRTCVRTIDAHAAGEPLRVVVEGFGDVPGDTMLAKRRFAREHRDDLRRALMLEPRGHADMYGCVPTEPVTPDGDVGLLFLHNEGWSTMCGHGVVAYTTVALEQGLVEPREPDVLRLDTPAGRVVARAERGGDRVTGVAFRNVPSFVLATDLEVDVPGLGAVRCDVAFGGAFYAFVDAAASGLSLAPANAGRVIEAGTRVKAAVQRALSIRHPGGASDLDFLYGTIFTSPPPAGAAGVRERNVCVFAAGELDRSPTGTGVSARAAILAARGELELGTWIRIESVIGTTFDVRAVGPARAGDLDAVVPEVRGRAWLTGRHEFWIDPSDPLAGGVSR